MRACWSVYLLVRRVLRTASKCKTWENVARVFMFTRVLLFSGWCRGARPEMSCCLMAWLDDGSNQRGSCRTLKSSVPPFSNTHTHACFPYRRVIDGLRVLMALERESWGRSCHGNKAKEASFTPSTSLSLSLCTWTELHLTHTHSRTLQLCVPLLRPQYTQRFVCV